MSNYLSLIESEADFEKRVCAEAARYYDTNKDIRHGCDLLLMTRSEYIHRYALNAWAQKPRMTTSTGDTTDWVYVRGGVGR